MIVFDGYARAAVKEKVIAEKVAELRSQGKELKIAAILFTEDSGSQLYTRLKSEAAQRVGIGYDVYSFSLVEGVEPPLKKLQELNADPTVTGIIIQKPSKRIWLEAKSQNIPKEDETQAFQTWWHSLVTQINIEKDVDGLHPETLATIEAGTWREQHKVMPATAKAVLEILGIAAQQIMHVPINDEQLEGARTVFLKDKKVIVIGKSDIVGKPVYYALKRSVPNIEMIGSLGLTSRIEQNVFLKDADVIISSTGRRYLITEELIKKGVLIVDVGEPMPDVDQASVREEAAYLTPVPGGVGPMTVVCLLENAVELVATRHYSGQ